VLVEGPIDAEVLSHVATIAGLVRLRFVSLPNLDPDERSGGKDKIIAFLKKSQGLVQNRSRQAPLFVLFDWEASKDELRRAKKAYGPGADDRVLRMNQEHCDPLLTKDFKGIERFYPPKVFRQAHDAGELTLGISNEKPYSVSQSQLKSEKGALRKRVLQIDSVDELKRLLKVVIDIENLLRHEYPVQIALTGLDELIVC